VRGPARPGWIAAPALLVVLAACSPAPAAGVAAPARPVVVLDPGHNGANGENPALIGRLVPDGRGGEKACNTTGTATDAGYPEHAFAWDVATRVADLLEEDGVDVVLTRPDDDGVGPCVDERGTAGQRADADAVVSAHAGLLNPSARAPLAEHIGDLRTIDLPDLSEAPMPPVEVLAVFGADEATCNAVRDARAGVAIALLRPRADAQSAERAVRAAAVLLSGPNDVTIDTAVPRVWPVVDPSTEVPRSADWFVLDRLAGGSGTRTHGLGRFGLPELVAENVAAADLPAWDAAIVGAVHVLLQRLAAVESDELVLQSTLRVTVADVAAGYAEPVDASDPTVRRGTELRLEHVPSDEDAGVLVLTGSPVEDLFARGDGS